MIPISVMPICTADRNRPGLAERARALCAPGLPAAAIAFRRGHLADTTASSESAKRALRRMRARTISSSVTSFAADGSSSKPLHVVEWHYARVSRVSNQERGWGRRAPPHLQLVNPYTDVCAAHAGLAAHDVAPADRVESGVISKTITLTFLASAGALNFVRKMFTNL